MLDRTSDYSIDLGYRVPGIALPPATKRLIRLMDHSAHEVIVRAYDAAKRGDGPRRLPFDLVAHGDEIVVEEQPPKRVYGRRKKGAAA